MQLRPDGSLLVQTALSMSRLSQDELSPEAAEITRLVRLTLGGDSTAFEQIIMRLYLSVCVPEEPCSGGILAAHDRPAKLRSAV